MTKPLRGLAVAPGLAVGPVFLVESASGEIAAVAGSPDEERERMHAALDEAAEEIRELACRVEVELGADEAGIFVAQAAFASDPALIRMAEDGIAAGESAEQSVSEAFQVFRRRLQESSSEYLAARAADLDDVRNRVVRVLAGRAAGPEAPSVPSVIVASELTPSYTAGLPAQKVVAIATERGTATSHAAILARARGIPCVVGVVGLMTVARGATHIAVDGTRGRVVPDPDEATRKQFEREADEASERREELRSLRSVAAVTVDGRRVEMAANVSSLSDLEVAVEVGAEGSGLVRTEFLFQDRTEPPSVDEQVDVYRRILETFPDQRVVFRTLDAGADKPLPFLPRPAEVNPDLGVRGIRLGLDRPALLEDQLRAIIRAGRDSVARVGVMFPMVTTASEIDEVLTVVTRVAADEDFDTAQMEIGAMVEIPVAALTVGRLARRLDFVSVGTNDLLQYLFAADRRQAQLADLPDLFEPAVLRLLGQLVDDAHSAGAWVGVCGESAGTVTGAIAFVGLRCDELSMAPNAIPEVKEALRRLRASDVDHAVRQAMVAPDAVEARQRVQSLLE